MKLKLGTFTLDDETRQLLRDFDEIHLSPKAFDLLTFLVENRPRALSKTELQAHLWPDTFVAEANLPSLIAEIRGALGDDARRPRFVRTAQRYGYAFCGPAADMTGQPASRSTAPLGSIGHAWLVVEGRRIHLKEGENILGREVEEGICLQSPTVSRRHARITLTGASATLEDLGSKNGTFLRGKPLAAPAALSDRDEIKIGSVVVYVRIHSDGSTMTRTSGSP